ncbi:MFS transporter [Actinomadura yumaensis]|uniref:MFS transporter n=1 Tax=Actinomadura yumaensis TaxID=111807 RepID=A0ABW2CI32_9ACTN
MDGRPAVRSEAAVGLGRYIALVGEPVTRRIGIPSAVARLPLGMTALALLLLVQRDSGSFALAGGVAASFALASGLTSPIRGRLVDRFGPMPVLMATGVLQPFALLSVVLFSTWLRDDAGVVVAAAAAGATLPPVGPVVRVLWQRLPSAGLCEAAFALDAVLLQVIYYGVGPPLVTALTVLHSPELAMFVIAGLTAVGTVLVASAPACRVRPAARERPPPWGALAAPGIAGVLVTVLVSSAAIGALEVAVTGFAAEHAMAGLAGLYLAAFGLGSIAGGLWYGSRSSRRALGAQYRLWLAVTIAGFAPLPLCSGPGWLAAFLVVGGFAVAPASIVQFRLVGELAQDSVLTEAFTWLLSASLAGAAVGNAAAGAVVEKAGSTAALGTALVLSAAAFLLSLELS